MHIKSMLKVVLISAICGGFTSVAVADQHMKASDPRAAEAEKMIADADAARKKAASVGSEWRDTGSIISKAKAALKAGDTVKAMKLASEAHSQGVLGYQQGAAQKELRMPSYIKY
jgi:hypothetical protein